MRRITKLASLPTALTTTEISTLSYSSKGAVVRRQSVPNQTHGKKQPEHGETQPPRNDLKEQKGGPQADQRAGEVERGAHNQRAKGRNPQSNDR